MVGKREWYAMKHTSNRRMTPIMNQLLREDILERNLIENLRLANSEMLRADVLIRRGPETFHSAPSASFLKKVIVGGGRPYSYMTHGGRWLWN